jgi:prepilin-type N-terminal cleavage/methylation domain-containing protein/prepilin-type processing-associated H-X9-DG protein
MKRGLQVVRPWRRGRRAFTLVELLVVVSIIALLISILLPSLKKAREQSKDVMCKADLRSMGQAFVMYGEKYQGVWPPAMDTLGEQNRWPVPFHLGDIIHAKLAYYDAQGKLLKGGEKSIFLCPSEQAERAIPNWLTAGHTVDRVEVGGSYSLNEEIHRNGGTIDRGTVSPPVPPFVNRADNCKRPSSVFCVVENARPLENPGTMGWRFNRGADESNGSFTPTTGAFWTGFRLYDGTPLGSQYQSKRNIGGRHNGFGNGLFIDSHVESYRPEKVHYDQVSWTPWPKHDTPPPGGI